MIYYNHLCFLKVINEKWVFCIFNIFSQWKKKSFPQCLVKQWKLTPLHLKIIVSTLQSFFKILLISLLIQKAQFLILLIKQYYLTSIFIEYLWASTGNFMGSGKSQNFKNILDYNCMVKFQSVLSILTG